MSRCIACGGDVRCPRGQGCYLVCLADCSACSGGCEPSTALPLRLATKDGSDLLDADIVFCSRGLGAESLIALFSALLERPVERLAGEIADGQHKSLRFEGKFSDLLKKARLQAVSA